MAGLMKRLALLVLASIFLAASLGETADRGTLLAVGDKAPDFTLVDQHGKLVRLSEVLTKRQHVILAFSIMAFTPG